MPLSIQCYNGFVQNGFCAALAFFREFFSETFLTDWSFRLLPEGLACQRSLTAETHKVLFMPVLVQGFNNFLQKNERKCHFLFNNFRHCTIKCQIFSFPAETEIVDDYSSTTFCSQLYLMSSGRLLYRFEDVL